MVIGSFTTTGAAATVFLAPAETHEHCDTESDECDDEVFVRGETAAVEEDVHDHYGDEFARFAEDHCWVGDVCECSETEGCGRGDEYCTLEVSG